MIEIEPLEVDTPLGRGYARYVDNGVDDYFWTVILSESGALVTFRQREIKAHRSFTYGRNMTASQMIDAIGKAGAE